MGKAESIRTVFRELNYLTGRPWGAYYLLLELKDLSTIRQILRTVTSIRGSSVVVWRRDMNSTSRRWKSGEIHTMTSDPDIRPLLIAGGLSARMGTAKHLLPCPDGRPLYQHTLQHLHVVCPSAETLYISLRDKSQLSSLSLDSSTLASARIQPLYDAASTGQGDSPVTVSNGPAAGLLAAYNFSPTTTWLVAGCDYPLLTTSALQQLVDEYDPPVTCFSNAEGWCEPLLAIWSPLALEKLLVNARQGRSGPNSVIRSIGGKVIRPKDERWIRGANTREEWDMAMEIARDVVSVE